MYLTEAVEGIREKLVRHPLSERTTLWATILKEIAKQGGFDGHYADTNLEVIRHFVRQPDDETTLSLWRQTETGMGDQPEEACLFPDSVGMDLEMEFLQEITDLAWEAAKAR
jgi:hypothetical protein